MNRSRAIALSALGLFGALAAGCERSLEAGAFQARYERECAVSIRSGDFQFVLLYESPEFLAVSTAGATAPMLDSLTRSYGNARYVRLSIRPTPRPGDEIPGVLDAKHFALDQMLRNIPGGLASKIRLRGPGGKEAKPIAVSLLSGTQTGSANTVMIAFSDSDTGGDFDPAKWRIIIDDFGLNLGTLESRLAAAKGFRLKVAT